MSRRHRGTRCVRHWTPPTDSSPSPRPSPLQGEGEIGGGPWPRLLEGGARRQHGFVGEAATGDLEPDRQPVSRQSGRYRGGRMAREGEGGGQAPAQQPVNSVSLYLGRPEGVAIGCVVGLQ